MVFDRRTFVGAACLAAASLFVRPERLVAAPHFSVSRSPDEWRRLLGADRYMVLREAWTERPFSSPMLNEHRKGIFVCAACNQDLFSSATKFDSGTGWPSFWKPLPRAVIEKRDRDLSVDLTEVLCSRCGGHLGHVFNDGPDPTGLRYCMNGLALSFRAA